MHRQPDEMKTFIFVPIGTIHTPFHDIAGMPIRQGGARVRKERSRSPKSTGNEPGTSTGSGVYPDLCVSPCSGYSLKVKPFLDTTPRGVFATRSPRRPNMIGLSVVSGLSVHGFHLEYAEAQRKKAIMKLEASRTHNKYSGLPISSAIN